MLHLSNVSVSEYLGFTVIFKYENMLNNLLCNSSYTFWQVGAMIAS